MVREKAQKWAMEAARAVQKAKANFPAEVLVIQRHAEPLLAVVRRVETLGKVIQSGLIQPAKDKALANLFETLPAALAAMEVDGAKDS